MLEGPPDWTLLAWASEAWGWVKLALWWSGPAAWTWPARLAPPGTLRCPGPLGKVPRQQPNLHCRAGSGQLWEHSDQPRDAQPRAAAPPSGHSSNTRRGQQRAPKAFCKDGTWARQVNPVQEGGSHSQTRPGAASDGPH